MLLEKGVTAVGMCLVPLIFLINVDQVDVHALKCFDWFT